jgi:GTP-binding protein
MSKKKKLPLIAICGRPNVGKSTLYNRICGKQRAIIHDLEGITRDRHYARATWENYIFDIVDTGGIVEHPEDAIVEKMQEQVRMALRDATVILFVVDGQTELTATDFDLRDELFRLGKPVVLAANKLDNPTLELNRHNFYELGVGEPFAISSGHGHGITELLEALAEHLPEPEAKPEKEITSEDEDGEPLTGDESDDDLEDEADDVDANTIKVAVIGKPNVGKSSFINAIMNEERVIVDSTAGTTRDAIDIEFQWQDQEYLLIDTAGMRKKAGVKELVEHFSIARSLRAVRRADVCLVMMDATEDISEQDKRIFGYVYEQGTAMIFVWTKWDLVEDKTERFEQLENQIKIRMPHLTYIPSITVSNLTRQRLFKTFELVNQIAESAKKRISTNALNKFMKDIKNRHKPPSQHGKYAKILYATQASIKPTTFVLFVNQKRLFHFSYLRFIENQLRKDFKFEGVPIHVELREETPEKSK